MKKKRHNTPKIKDETKPLVYEPWMIAWVIAVTTILFYRPSINNGFVNWDDAGAVIENPHIRFLNHSSFQWMFTTFHTGNWIPLTWFSFSLDYALGKLDPKVYHLHNLLLHTINSVLVFFLSLNILKLVVLNGCLSLEKLSNERMGKITPTLWSAALTALLFALHPIHVESVAWITERKDLLCCLFFFASLLVYLDYISSDKGKSGKWWICLGLFTLALLSKPMAITLPLVLLLLDIWPLNRFDSKWPKILWEKIPFFLLSIFITITTIFAQSSAGAIADTTEVSIDFRLMNAFHSLVFYMWKMIIPIDLVPFYPITHQGAEAFSAANVGALLIVILTSIVCFIYRKYRPYLALSGLYYFITLAPVLGIIQVGGQAAADRYSYIPSLSILLLFSTSVVVFFYHYRLVLTGLSSGLIIILGFTTMQQIFIWNNSVSLWERVLKIYPNISMIAHTNMGNAYKQFGRLNEALCEYDRALACGHPHAYIYDGKGTVLLDKELLDEAIEAFHQAIALNPNYASPHRNLWFAYDKKGLVEEAIVEALEAIRINPEFDGAYNNLGISFGRKSLFEESINAFRQALSLDPYNSMYLINLATTYQRAGELDQAIEWYKRGLMQNSKEPVYFLNLAHTYLLKGMVTEAIKVLEAATHLEAPTAEIFQKLGLAYEKMGQLELAKQNYEMTRHFKKTK